eukprot:scaffold285986_cov30-Tisochrysis_lutea.AAC.1
MNDSLYAQTHKFRLSRPTNIALLAGRCNLVGDARCSTCGEWRKVQAGAARPPKLGALRDGVMPRPRGGRW